jgi:hypothetical protein
MIEMVSSRLFLRIARAARRLAFCGECWKVFWDGIAKGLVRGRMGCVEEEEDKP